MAQIFLIQPGKLLFHVHIPVQINVTVGRMVVSPVKIKELLIGQIRNKLRVASGFIRIGSVREQRVQNHPIQYTLRGGKCSFHLVVYDAVVFQLVFRGVKLITPAFLPEDFLMLIDVRVEHGIHVDVHQILKILVVAACHRINGLVRIGHGIQEGIQGAFHQFHEGILRREILRAAQDRMLHDMRDSRAVARRCPETDRKYLVVVVLLYQKNPCLALLVPEQITFCLDSNQFLFLH